MAYEGAVAAARHVLVEARSEYMLKYVKAALMGERQPPPVPSEGDVLREERRDGVERRRALGALQLEVRALVQRTREGRNTHGVAVLLLHGPPRLPGLEHENLLGTSAVAGANGRAVAAGKGAVVGVVVNAEARIAEAPAADGTTLGTALVRGRSPRPLAARASSAAGGAPREPWRPLQRPSVAARIAALQMIGRRLRLQQLRRKGRKAARRDAAGGPGGSTGARAGGAAGADELSAEVDACRSKLEELRVERMAALGLAPPSSACKRSTRRSHRPRSPSFACKRSTRRLSVGSPRLRSRRHPALGQARHPRPDRCRPRCLAGCSLSRERPDSLLAVAATPPPGRTSSPAASLAATSSPAASRPPLPSLLLPPPLLCAQLTVLRARVRLVCLACVRTLAAPPDPRFPIPAPATALMAWAERLVNHELHRHGREIHLVQRRAANAVAMREAYHELDELEKRGRRSLVVSKAMLERERRERRELEAQQRLEHALAHGESHTRMRSAARQAQTSLTGRARGISRQVNVRVVRAAGQLASDMLSAPLIAC